MKLREFVAEALENAVYYRQGGESDSIAADADCADDGATVLVENCELPLIRGECGPKLKSQGAARPTDN